MKRSYYQQRNKDYIKHGSDGDQKSKQKDARNIFDVFFRGASSRIETTERKNGGA